MPRISLGCRRRSKLARSGSPVRVENLLNPGMLGAPRERLSGSPSAATLLGHKRVYLVCAQRLRGHGRKRRPVGADAVQE